MLSKRKSSINCNIVDYSNEIVVTVNGEEIKTKQSSVIAITPLNFVMASVEFEYTKDKSS